MPLIYANGDINIDKWLPNLCVKINILIFRENVNHGIVSYMMSIKNQWCIIFCGSKMTLVI